MGGHVSYRRHHFTWSFRGSADLWAGYWNPLLERQLWDKWCLSSINESSLALKVRTGDTESSHQHSWALQMAGGRRYHRDPRADSWGGWAERKRQTFESSGCFGSRAGLAANAAEQVQPSQLVEGLQRSAEERFRPPNKSTSVVSWPSRGINIKGDLCDSASSHPQLLKRRCLTTLWKCQVADGFWAGGGETLQLSPTSTFLRRSGERQRPDESGRGLRSRWTGGVQGKKKVEVNVESQV